jgi:glycosyltransferase involved in cell wall biosynthesis
VVVPHRRAMELVAGRGIPDRKLTVVLNTADERIFRPRLAAPANKEAGKFLVVTHGAVLERYGIQVLIAALPRVIAEVPNVEVQVFGEGEYRPTLEAQARRLGVDGYVKFRGFVPMDDLVATLSRADAGYVGMLNDLTRPNKLMEYIALGVPVLLARWAAFESYFPADAVYYFGPGNGDELAAAILAIFREPDEARRRVRRAWQLYRTYGWERQQRIYLGVYAELLSLGQTQGLIGEDRSRERVLSLPDWPGPRP